MHALEDRLPHRGPMLFLQNLQSEPDRAWSHIELQSGTPYLQGEKMAMHWLIEFAAQTAGGLCLTEDQKAPPSFLVGIRHFSLKAAELRAGDSIQVEVTLERAFAPIFLVQARITHKGLILAEGQLQLFVKSAETA